MERINAYSTPTQDGGVSVDVEAMAVDLVTVFKAGGFPKADFLDWISEIFDNTQVQISIPNSAKN